MNITITTIKENKDGSADAIVKFDKDGLAFLVQEGAISILKQYVEQNKNAQDGVKLRKKLTKKEVK
jgi:hypothetical protein